MIDSNKILLLPANFDPIRRNSINSQISYYKKLMRQPQTEEHKKITQQYLEDALEELTYLESLPEGSLEKLATKIKVECRDFYNAFKKCDKVLFRGYKYKHPPAFESMSPVNREPKDSDVNNTILFDKFAQELGIEALRSNSIFTISSECHARYYGILFVIYPKDTADFSWSESRREIILYLEHKAGFKDLKSFQEIYKLKKTDLDAALKSEHEVLIHGRYIAIKYQVYEDMIKEKLL